MKVLIDLTSLADNFSGIERFALSITKELISDQSRSDIEYILVFKNEVHKEFAEEQHNVKKIIVRGKNKLIFNQLQLPLKLATIKADYYFFPAFPAPFFFFDRNAISAIHDVGCWDCPSKNKKYMTLYFKLMYRKAALGHKKVVTVSQFSKNRISKILKKESDEIAVIYDGLSDCFANFYYDRGQDMKATNAVLIPSLMQNGAVIASVASELITNMVQFVYMKKKVKFKLNMKPLVQSIITVAAMAVCVWKVGTLNFSNTVLLALEVIVGSVVYVVLNILMKNQLMLEVINMTKQRIHNATKKRI